MLAEEIRSPEWLPFVGAALATVGVVVAVLSLRFSRANYRAAGYKIVARTLWPKEADEHSFRLTNKGRSAIDIEDVVALPSVWYHTHRWAAARAHPISHLIDPVWQSFRLEGHQSRTITLRYGHDSEKDFAPEYRYMLNLVLLKQRQRFGKIGVRLGNDKIVTVPRLKRRHA